MKESTHEVPISQRDTPPAIRDSAEPDEIRRFYGEDLERRVQARVNGNPRIDKAVDFVLRNIGSDSRVLDVGCGIGIAAERVARKATRGGVVGVDISPAHIDYCRRTVSLPNVTFIECNVLVDFEQLARRLEEPIDSIIMIDVVEHLPAEEAHELFKAFTRVLADTGQILLTYPAPEYQRKLYATSGSRIQAIDRIVEHEELLTLARAAGCQIHSFQYVDVWRRNQYIHCRLSRTIEDGEYGPWERFAAAPTEERVTIIMAAVRKLARRLARPWRQYRYLTRPRQQ